MIGKKLTLILVLLGGGIALICIGAVNYFHTRKLVAEGRPATAIVVDRQSWEVTSETKAHRLTVVFQAESRQWITNDVMVTAAVYDGVTEGGTVDLVYFPKDPSICAIGSSVEVNYSQFVVGCSLIGLGVLVIKFFKRHPRLGEMPTDDEITEKVRPQAASKAKKIVETMASFSLAKYEHEAVEASRFTHLDLNFYNTQRTLLESRGFRYLEDNENVTLRNSANNPNTFTRVMLSGDGTVMASFFHFKPKLLQKMIGVKELKVLGLETRFSNGCFLSTSNTGDQPQLSQPAEVHDLGLPRTMTFDKLLEFHQQRIATFTSREGARPVRMEGMPDVRKACDEVWALKAAHRQRVGMTAEDWQNLSGGKKGDRASDLLFEEVLREHGRSQTTKS